MEIYLQKNASKIGPYSEIQVRDMLGSGLITEKEMGWCEGLTDWIPVGLIVVGASPSVLQNPSYSNVNRLDRKRFRVMVGLSIMIFVACMLALLMEPEPSQTQSGNNSSSDAVVGVALLVIIMCPSYIGLLLIKKWGRNLFILTTILMLILVAFGGAITVSATANVLETISDIFTGAIIAVSFFTPLFNVPARS
jgi:hypothetical protein